MSDPRVTEPDGSEEVADKPTTESGYPDPDDGTQTSNEETP